MVSSRVYPSLERKKGGPDNWVEAVGGLPDYIERIAKHLHYEKGMSISRAIATAVSQVKKWAAGGKNVSAATRAKAARALAQWTAKKARSKAKDLTDDQFAEVIELTIVRAGAGGSKPRQFDETKHARSPLDGKFGKKFTPSQLIAARRTVEAGIARLLPGQTVELPGNTGWVKRDQNGYTVQGPAGIRAVVRNLSEAVVVAAQIVAGNLKDVATPSMAHSTPATKPKR